MAKTPQKSEGSSTIILLINLEKKFSSRSPVENARKNREIIAADTFFCLSSNLNFFCS